MVRSRRRAIRGSRRGRIPATRELNYATAKTGTQTAFARKDFKLLAGCGDRSFKIVGLALQISSLTEPVILQVHIFNQALNEIALCNRLITSNNVNVRLRVPNSFKQWFSGDTAQNQSLIRIDLIPTYKGQQVNVSFLLSLLFRLGVSEITAH